MVARGYVVFRGTVRCCRPGSLSRSDSGVARLRENFTAAAMSESYFA